ncbi:MAG: hypothetical protein JWP85_2227 [Rhodoglobus sp.]|nr:hypothetical protein [Rhodoglobus sp.]
MADRTRQPYAYTGNNPLLFTDPTGLDWLSDFGENAGAFGLGALDGLTMGISSMVLSATVPGYDCFVEQHSVAFTAGSVVAQVVQFAVLTVGTLGAGTGLAIGMVAARVAIKEAMHVAVAAVKRVITTGVTAAGRTALSVVQRIGIRSGERIASAGIPTLKIDAARMPNIAANVQSALKEGHPGILNRTTDAATIRSNRAAACESFCGRGSPDEYPFASTFQGGQGARVADVPLAEQRIQGGVMSSFYQRHGIGDGDSFRVLVEGLLP